MTNKIHMKLTDEIKDKDLEIKALITKNEEEIKNY